MLDVTRANADLLRYYKSVWPALQAVRERETGTSGLHLVRIPGGWARAPVRLLVIGQETMGWDNKETPETQMERYPDDGVVDGKRHTPFWRAARELTDAVSGAPGSPVLWANLVPADVGRRRASPEVRDALRDASRGGLLRPLLDAAAPDAAVFFTGPSGYYAYEMRQQFPGLEELGVEGFSRRGLVRLKHEALPAASFRTYHPAYLQRTKRWGDLVRLADEIGAVSANLRRRSSSAPPR